MLGSANFRAGRLMAFMSGNLCYQIEHHLFPDLPSNRYAEIAPQVQALFEKHGLSYVTGSFPKQLASAWHKVFRLALPNDFRSQATKAVIAGAAPERVVAAA
jgi:linoleoyl-CoA desaturase